MGRVFKGVLAVMLGMLSVTGMASTDNVTTAEGLSYYVGDIASVETGLDGLPDIYIAGTDRWLLIPYDVLIPVPIKSAFQPLLLCGQPDGSYIACTPDGQVNLSSLGQTQVKPIWGDFDGDGKQDVLLQSSLLNTNSVYLSNQGDGSFVLQQQFIDFGGYRVSGAAELAVVTRADSNGKANLVLDNFHYATLENGAFVVIDRPVDGGGSGALLKTELTASLVGEGELNSEVSANGSLQVQLPISLPLGVNGLQPNLAVVYDSAQSRSGNLGVGAALQGISTLMRCGSRTASGDDYTAKAALTQNDRLCLDGQRLIVTTGDYWAANSSYRLENGGNIKVTQTGTGASATYQVHHPDGHVSSYDFSFAPNGASLPLLWSITQTTDAFGNHINYSYDASINEYVPRFIRYGDNNDIEVELIFNPVNTQRYFVGGGAYLRSQALSSLVVRAGGDMTYEYRMIYGSQPYGKNGQLQLKAVQKCGFTQGVKSCAKATKLSWAETAATMTPASSWSDKPSSIVASLAADWDGDGQDDAIMTDEAHVYAWLGQGETRTRQTLYSAPSGGKIYALSSARLLDSGQISLVVGVGSVTSGSNPSWTLRWYELKQGAAATQIAVRSGAVNSSTAPLLSPFRFAKPVVLDYQGDGYADLLLPYPDQWMLYSAGASSTAAFSLKNTLPASALPANVTPFAVDINGDGLAEVVYKNASLTAYQVVTLNRLGVATATTLTVDGAILDPKKTVWGDFNGDGLTDIISGSAAHLTLYWAKGDGTYQAQPTNISSSTLFISANTWEKARPDQYYVRTVDYNHDGRDDLVFYNPNAASGGASNFYVMLADGNDFTAPESTSVPVYLRPAAQSIPYSYQTGDDPVSQGDVPLGVIQQLYGAFFNITSQIIVNFSDGDMSGILSYKIPVSTFYPSCTDLAKKTQYHNPFLFSGCVQVGAYLEVMVDLDDPHVAPDYPNLNVEQDIVPVMSQILTSWRNGNLNGAPTFPFWWPSSLSGLADAQLLVEDCAAGQYPSACHYLENNTFGFWFLLKGFYNYHYPNTSTISGSTSVLLNMSDFLPLDINGDGVTDLIAPTESTSTLSAYLNAATPAHITQLTNDLGAKVKVSYALATNSSIYQRANTTSPANTITLNPRGYLISSLVLPTGQSGGLTLNYQYQDARASRDGRGGLGFAQTQISDVTRGTQTTNTYAQQFPYIGRLVSAQIADQTSGEPLLSTQTTWANIALPNTVVRYAYVSDSLSTHYINALPTSVTRNQQSFSLVDNQVFQNDSDTQTIYASLNAAGQPQTPVSSVAHHYQYNQRLSQWLLGFASQTTRISIRDSHSLTTVTTRTPYGNSNQVQTQVDYLGDAALERTTQFTYSASGIPLSQAITAKINGQLHTRTTSTPSLIAGRFAAKVINALGYGDSTNRIYDLRFGKLRRQIDANGLYTAYAYDPFGRLLSLVNPDGSEQSNSYTLCNANECAGTFAQAAYYVTTRLTHSSSNQAGAPTTYSYYDVLGRLMGTHQTGFDGSLIESSRSYDALGRLATETTPHYLGDTGSQSTWQYDQQDRPVQEQQAAGSLIGYSYTARSGGGITTTRVVTLANHNSQHRSHTVVAHTDATGLLISRTDDASGVNATSHYTYGAQGLRTQVVINGTQTSHMAYDNAGNLTQLTDPNTGVTHYTYNGFGERLLTTKANGNSLSYQTDALGRRIGEVTQANGQSSTRTWVYDQDPNHACGSSTSGLAYGQLACRTASGFSEHYQYDSLARPMQAITQLTNKAGQVHSYTRQYGYDAYSRLLNTQWPNGTTSHWQYNLAGYPSGVEDAQQQWLYGITAQDAWNRPTDISLAAGAIQQTATSATNSGRPLSVVTQATSTALQHATWQWWSNGSMAERTTLTAGGNRTDAFSYDGLERLTQATASGATTATDSASYTTSGNIATKTGITGQYSYSSSQPYAVISAGGTSYGYDAAGNMTQRGNTNITYNAIGQPLSFYQAANELTRFAYDSDYARYYQWAKLANGDTQETFYIGASYEEKVTHHLGGSTSTEQYAYVNDAVLQVTTGTTTDTRYLLRDALHSVEAVLNDQGQLLERLSYDTWGKPDATPQYTTRSYTGQEYLPQLQLIHLNGRVYDPSLGRFLSADPLVQAPDFSQSYNRYSYVWNNPVSAWDPTGYELEPIADQDLWAWGIFKNEQLFLSNIASWNAPTSYLDVGVGAAKGASQLGYLMFETQYPLLNKTVDWLSTYVTGHDLNYYLTPQSLEEQYGAGLFSVGSVVAPVAGLAAKLGWAGKLEVVANTAARDAPVGMTQVGERFVRVGHAPENLKFTFDNPGGVMPGTYAFPESVFNKIGRDPARLKDLGDLPGAAPNYFRIFEPPAGTPIQRGVVPGGEFGGRGGVPEVIFPEGF